MPQLLPFTVFAFNESTGQIVSHHVIAANGLNAFAAAAEENKDTPLAFVAALDGHQSEGVGVTFPGNSIVSTDTVLEQSDVFGVAPSPEDLPVLTTVPTNLFVHVEALLAVDQLDFEDKSVSGIYVVLVDPGTPVKALANAALDGFHSSIPISCLDHFKIEVRTTVDLTSDVLSSADGYDNGLFERSTRILTILGPAESAQIANPAPPAARKRLKP